MIKKHDDRTIEEQVEATGIPRSTLLYQLDRGYWKVGDRLGAEKRSGVWFIEALATLQFPERRKTRTAIKLAYPRVARKIGKRKI